MRNSNDQRSFARKAGNYLMLILFVVYALFPIAQFLLIALRPAIRLHSASTDLIPRGATLDNFRGLFTETQFLRWFLNSTLVALVVTVTGVAMASAAGYALSRRRFSPPGTILKRLLATQIFPLMVLLLPLYVVLISLHLINSYLGLIVIYTATALPFCIWQLKLYYDTIPLSLEEAACIDGCTPWQTFHLVILPLVAPGIVITALFSFVTAWNEHVVISFVLQDSELFTLPVGLKIFQGNTSTHLGLSVAGALIVSIPVVILFLILSRLLISGVPTGGRKE
jgi:arabinogalactan oligomer/maltooligosaccharide transport system permease protein